jgi:NAD(P)-dependent dehydrogenase (short-subunit alcohol dehydrogenase family)
VTAAGSLAGRGAVVTGGGRGIGAAVAAALAAAGAGVVVAARTAAEIEAVAARLRERGTRDGGSARTWAVATDVADETQVRGLAARAAELLGTVDVLVNAAGDGGAAPLERITLADWHGMLEAHATGTFLCTRELLPRMRERRFGRIVNIASVAGLEGARYVAHYCAAKHAVVGFTRAAACELEGSGVTINALCPGYVDTPMTARTIANVVARTGRSAEAALASVLASARQERLLSPDEVAEAVLGLCAEAAAGTSGRAITLMPSGDACISSS